MAPVAMNGLKLSPRVAERRKKIIEPKISNIMIFVANAIFTSGARTRERKNASANAAASSGTQGSCLSSGFLLAAMPFSTFGLREVFLLVVCP